MAGLADMVTASQIAASIDLIRFDRAITGFEFKPSIGIAARKFAELADEFGDLSDPLKKSVQDIMTISILENFMSGGRPSWPAMSENTRQKREKNGSGTMLMVRTGSLAETASSMGIWSIGKTAAVIKDLPNNVWYGKIHQAGQAGNEYSGGNWFQKYQMAAAKTLGREASKKEIDDLAFKIWGKRSDTHGPAPVGQPEIPARPFIMFQEEDIDAIQNIFAEWVEEKVMEAGL